MKIFKFEQSGFILETEKGFRVAFDIGNKTPIEKLENVKVDAMFVTHIHGDHFSLEQIKKLSPKKLYLGEQCKEALGKYSPPFETIEVKADNQVNIEDIKIKIFDVDHGPNVTAPVKQNFGFLIVVDNKKIYFAGEMFYESGISVSNLEVDYAFFPIGTFYTFGPKEAFAFAKKFKKIGEIIPMHYEKTPETKIEFLNLIKGYFNISQFTI